MAGSLMVSAASIGVLCNPIIGWLNDKFGPRTGVTILIACEVIGIVLIAWIAGINQVLLMVGAFLLGMQGRVVAVEFPLILEAIFGRNEMAKCYSYIQIGTGLIGGFGFAILSIPYDLTGSLYMSFTFGLILAIVIFCIIQFSFAYAKKNIIPDWNK
jgi:MFS family permease